MLLSNLRQRLARDERGFTLIELLVVLIIIAVLLAIAVPSYLGFKDRAENRAAGANVRSAIPAVEAYYSDNGSYTGMSIDALKLIDSGLKLSAVNVVSPTSYCVESTHDGTTSGRKVHHLAGPGGNVIEDACPKSA